MIVIRYIYNRDILDILTYKQFQIDYRYRIEIDRQIDKYRIDIRQIERIDIPIYIYILDRNIKQLEEEIEERVRIVYLIGKINFEL